MNSYFTADFFAGNRQRLREAVAGDVPIVITASGLLQRANDSTYPFRQDASFWYLTGINEADLVLVMDGVNEYLIVPELTDYQNIFDGSLTASELSERSGIKIILSKKEGWKKLRTRLQTASAIVTLAANPDYIATYGMFTNPARKTLIKRLKAAHPKLTVSDIRLQLARLRSRKQAPELAAMQQAIDLTVQALQAVSINLDSYSHEYQVEAAITGYMLLHGAQDAWKPTVGAGRNSCILHSPHNRAELRKGDVVVVDIGAEVEHYCADITRTLAIGGKPSGRQVAVYEAVKRVQQYGFSLQKSGSTIRANEKLVEAFMGEQLIKLGLITNPTRQNIRRYYPHATSHYLGLDPHDAGDYDEPLEPGMVLTVEPGIYIPEEGIGVRIEDDVLITESGYEILSDKLPRTLV